MATKSKKAPVPTRTPARWETRPDLSTSPSNSPTPPKDTGEARLLLGFLFGLVGLSLMGYLSFTQQEFADFGLFLRGQTGLDIGALIGSAIFWKLLIGFGAGAGVGALVGAKVRPGNVVLANTAARYAAIFIVTMIIYIPAMSAGYIWDDDQEITANPSLKNVSGLVEIWKGEKSADYFPLKTTMLWVEYQLWGLSSPGYHVMNIIVHAIAAMLLVVALKKFGVPGAWLAGLLFAIHPTHVESVAWVSERKNTLSMVFFLLTFIAYFKFEETNRKGFYLWALLAFVAGLLCKTHVVVLPMALVLCCWWRQGKITQKDILRSIPFFLLALFFSWLTIKFQHERAVGQEEIENFGGWGSRFAMAGMAPWWYLYKAIIPAQLNTIYPIWPIIPPKPEQWACGVAFLAFMGTLWIYAKKQAWVRACFFALAYFIATLLPVLGFIKMSYMRVTLVADHFQYISNISIILLGSAGVVLLYRRLKQRSELGSKLLVAAVCMILLTLSGYSWNRAGTYQNEETLWTDTLSKNPNTWQAHNHMGAIYYMRQDHKKAIYHFKRGVDLRPGNCEVQNNLGLALAALGNLDAALERYAEAVRIKGDDASIRTNYANGLSQAKRYDEAIVQYQEAAKLPSPNRHGILFNLGNTFLLSGRFGEAIQAYQEALKVAPDFADAQRNMQFALAQQILQQQQKAAPTPAPAPAPAGQ